MANNDLKNKFSELTRMKYYDQAKWFLNGFWEEGLNKDPESIWKCAQKFVELDLKKKEGNELDEFLSHKFLETLGETLTVLKMREKLREIDMDNNGKMALLEYLAFKYNKSIPAVINSPQGDNKKEIDEAQAKLDGVSAAYVEVQAQLDEQTKALEEQKVAEEAARNALASQKKAEAEAKAAEEVSRKALEDQKKAEEIVRKAEAELKAAVDDLKSQEDAYHGQIKNLEQKSKDANASTVSKSKAANELAQLKGEDPLPLRKAKISQEAALRKVEKERKAAEAVTASAANKANEAEKKAREAEAASASAEEKARESEEKTRLLEEQKVRVEESFREAERLLEEAKAYFEEVKKKGGVAHGAIWWMEREFTENQKYLPQRKQAAKA